MESKKVYLVLGLSLLYLTFSLACDPLDFRLVGFFGYAFSGSALLYASLYTILDMLTRIAGKSMTIRLILLFHFFDFLFTYMLYTINLLPMPTHFQLMGAYNSIITPMPRLFWAGIIGSITAGIVEVLIFGFLQQKIKSFFLASVSATLFILLAHNIPTDYIALHKLFPHIYLQLILLNFSICSISVIFSSMIATILFSAPRIKSLLPSERALATS
jgi:uncharacterized PurR-regulated membrane protein YhhQ (DUF165 family)